MFVSGDNFNKIASVSIYERKYYNDFIKHNNIENIIFVGENNTSLFNSIKNNRLVFFTKVEQIDYFVNSILPYLKEKFIIITHNGDLCSGKNEVLLNHPLFVRWYGQNMMNHTSKTIGIPIGLENKIWKRTNFNLLQSFSINSKTKLLYLNFSRHTNVQRNDIMQDLLGKGFSRNEKLPWDKYIEDLSHYKFALSPFGNGPDCHRTWECLYLNVIPIVIHSNPMKFFTDLPILFVNSFDVITPDFLEKTYDNYFKNKQFHLDKLYLSYWKTEIHKDLQI
jgi:hypothetical protein